VKTQLRRYVESIPVYIYATPLSLSIYIYICVCNQLTIEVWSHNKQNQCNNLLFSDPIQPSIRQPTPGMATLSNRRHTLPQDDIDGRAITTDSISTNYRTMPYLVTEKTVLQPHLGRQESFRRNIGHVAAETYLITRLAITLLRYLG